MAAAGCSMPSRRASPDQHAGTTRCRRGAVARASRLPDADAHRRNRTKSLDEGAVPGARGTISTSTTTMACAAACGVRARHLARRDRDAAPASRGAAIAHCPTSNFFLGSGAFDIGRDDPAGAAGTGRARHRHRRRHVVLDPGDARRSLQSRPAQSPSPVGGARLLSRHPRRGAGDVSRRQDRQPGARHGGRPRGARHAVDAADRLPHERPGTSPSSSSSR